MDVPVARYRRRRWKEGRKEDPFSLGKVATALSECQEFQMKILLTSRRLVAWSLDGLREGYRIRSLGPKRDDKILAGIKLVREKLGSRCLFIQGFSSV